MIDDPLSRYHEYGCQYRNKSVPLSHHEQKCRFLPLPCVTSMANCAAKIPAPLMETHLRAAHGKVQFWEANQLKLCYLVDEGEMVGDAEHYPGHLLTFDGRGFYLGVCKVAGAWRIWVSFIGAEQAAENYQVCLYYTQYRVFCRSSLTVHITTHNYGLRYTTHGF